jgi:hypothetical protein
LELEGYDNDKLTVIVSNNQPGREERTWRCGRAHGQQRKRQFRYDEETTRSNDFAHIALTTNNSSARIPPHHPTIIPTIPARVTRPGLQPFLR